MIEAGQNVNDAIIPSIMVRKLEEYLLNNNPQEEDTCIISMLERIRSDLDTESNFSMAPNKQNLIFDVSMGGAIYVFNIFFFDVVTSDHFCKLFFTQENSGTFDLCA